jgi:DNA-directed RNA polymerase subunit RPC12/RpoP
VSELRAADVYEVVCPHCKKPFSAELLGEGTPGQRGFKCPHCNLFVPLERADGDEPEAG